MMPSTNHDSAAAVGDASVRVLPSAPKRTIVRLTSQATTLLPTATSEGPPQEGPTFHHDNAVDDGPRSTVLLHRTKWKLPVKRDRGAAAPEALLAAHEADAEDDDMFAFHTIASGNSTQKATAASATVTSSATPQSTSDVTTASSTTTASSSSTGRRISPSIVTNASSTDADSTRFKKTLFSSPGKLPPASRDAFGVAAASAMGAEVGGVVYAVGAVPRLPSSHAVSAAPPSAVSEPLSAPPLIAVSWAVVGENRPHEGGASGTRAHAHTDDDHATPFPTLDTEQLRSATAARDKPIVIKAGAGSGKTQTIATRIAFLIQRGVPAYRILVMSFSRDSSLELRERAKRVLPVEFRGEASHLKVKTIHSFCLELIRRYRPGGDRLHVFGERDRRQVARVAVEKVATARRDSGVVTDLLKFADLQKRKYVSSRAPGDYALHTGDEMHRLFLAYEEELHAVQGACDFGDLQVFALQLLDRRSNGEEGCAEVLADVRHRFTHFVLDEAQDVDEVQYEILCRLVGDECRMSCVGDPRQSIYGFRGAMRNFFQQWSRRFQIPESGFCELFKNYRSIQEIVDVSNAVASEASTNVSVKGSAVQRRGDDGGDGTLGAPPPGAERVHVYLSPSDTHMLERLCEIVKHFLSERSTIEGAANRWRPSDIGILARKGATCQKAMLALQYHRIPYRLLRRQDPNASEIVYAFAAHLRLVLDPHRCHVDDVLTALEHPKKGIPKTYLFSLRVVKDLEAKRTGSPEVSYFSILERLVDNRFMGCDERVVPRSKKQRAALVNFVQWVRDAHESLRHYDDFPTSNSGDIGTGFSSAAAPFGASTELLLPHDGAAAAAPPVAAARGIAEMKLLVFNVLELGGFVSSLSTGEGSPAPVGGDDRDEKKKATRPSTRDVSQLPLSAAAAADGPPRPPDYEVHYDDEGELVDPVVSDCCQLESFLNEVMVNLSLTTDVAVDKTAPLSVCTARWVRALIDVLQGEGPKGDFGATVSGAATKHDPGSDVAKLAASMKEQQQHQTLETVTVATVHKAKGLEWPVVIVVDVTEGEMPVCHNEGRTAREEEQRIFYVAVSRAMEHLYLLGRRNAAAEVRESRYLDHLRKLSCVRFHDDSDEVIDRPQPQKQQLS